ncbi:MAG: DUF1015 domain-containing protein [Deltaproteobacteria bacterium]|nr:DUF1015 domain-containing protein [Deltaproteobacteria bacterium]MBI3062555.1 DUF1015 domain-containing protein [Deltaproteobacteria bacterium]
MVQIAPFRGILYNEKKIRDLSKVIAPPYDVITPEEQDRLCRKSPYNFVRLILSQEPEPYESVARLFEGWRAEGIFVRDDRPALYFLSHRFSDNEGKTRERLGFIALARIEDFSTGAIRPHEKTLAAPKEDRLRLMLACHANLSPIFALYAHPKQTINNAMMEQAQGVAPTLEVKEDGGGTCLLWRISDPEVIRLAQREMAERPLLIADGHHRYEAALNYRNRLREERKNFSGREPFNYVMMYFSNMNDDGLVILPTHRLVRSFPSIPFQKLEEELQRHFYLEPYPKTPEGQRWFLRALRSGGRKRHMIGASFKRDPRYLILRLKSKRIMQRLAKDLSDPLRDLDVSALHLLILAHILGIPPEEQVQGEVISYSQDEERVLKAVDKEDYQAAFILNPPKPEEILAVVQRGEKMPQKSTYFYPKLISGLVINKIDADEEVA